MAPWIIPALKAILPHVGTIVRAAKPVFTKKGSDVEVILTKSGTDAEPGQLALVQQQIAELQTAASRNAENTRELAEQLQDTVKALEQGAAQAQARLRRVLALSLFAALASLLALLLVAFGVGAPR